jgi:hypothetical protein
MKIAFQKFCLGGSVVPARHKTIGGCRTSAAHGHAVSASKVRDDGSAVAGFRLEHRWAGWDRSPFTGKSARHVSVYAKTGAA